jgi:hypothetical protein
MAQDCCRTSGVRDSPWPRPIKVRPPFWMAQGRDPVCYSHRDRHVGTLGRTSMISAKKIVTLRNQASDIEETLRLKRHFAEARGVRNPFFMSAKEFDWVLHWKLGGQYGRQERLRRDYSEDLIRTITGAAFAVSLPDRDLELQVRTSILVALPGVGVPIASAVLALVCPERYGVLDFRAWRQVFPGEAIESTIRGYQRYMHAIWDLSDELGWAPQEVDLAIWEYDRRANRRTK